MFFEKVLNIIYPKVCGICGRKIYENKTYTCEKCSNIIQYSMIKGICKNLEGEYLDKQFSLFRYKGIIREKILEFKFENKAYLGRMFSEMMSKFILDSTDFDIIIPVPIHIKRYFERGYNQSAILAKNISRNLKIKVDLNVLKKSKYTVPQSTLNSNMRKKNIKDTYKIKNEKYIKDKKVLLVDDVYTTGATANECAKILKENGAREVSVITIAYGKFSKEDF